MERPVARIGASAHGAERCVAQIWCNASLQRRTERVQNGIRYSPGTGIRR